MFFVRLNLFAYTFCRFPRMLEPTKAAMAPAPSTEAPATCAATRLVLSSGRAYTRPAAATADTRPAVVNRPGVPLCVG